MKIGQTLLVVILSVAAAYATTTYVTSHTNNQPTHESTFARVMQTKTIRCGYVIYPPQFMKDSASGQMSGILYDLTELLGQKLRLKIEWTQETSWGTAAQDLDSNRFDMICSGFWVNSLQASAYGYTKPLFYQVMWPIVRGDDTRFDKDIQTMNDPAIRITGMDGDIPIQIHDEQFPKAQMNTLQNFTDYNQLMMEIASNKADVTFLDGDFAMRYMKANPGKLKLLTNHGPTRVYANPWAIKRGELDFAEYLNAAIDEIVYSDEVEPILKKYGAYPEGYYLANKPYHPYQ